MSTTNQPPSAPERQHARYPNVMRICSETPWAIRAEKLVVIRDLLALRASGVRLSAEDIEARIGAASTQRQTASTGTVGVLPIYGTIIPRASLFSDISGGTSIEGLSSALKAMVADDSIGAILLDVDSPGGLTDLVPEFAAEIRNARGTKPIVAIANTDAASAAYWLASQADELVVTPSGLVGSIGVFAAHEDISAQQEQDGVATTLISAGKYKVESTPFAPLSDEARATIQGRVDAFYAMFIDDVAAGRGVAASAVKAGFGEGRVVTARDALKAGMVDRVDTFEATVERLIVQAATGKHGARAHNAQPSINAHDPEAAASGLSFAEAALAVRDAADQLTTDARSLCASGRDRRLTVAKRDALAAVVESLQDSAMAISDVLAQTDPTPGVTDVQRAFLEYVRSNTK